MPYYRLAPGVDSVPLSNDALLFRSTTLAIKVDGSMATVLRERLMPLLQQGCALDELQSSLPDLAADDLKASLDSLVDARVLVRSAETLSLGQDHPFAAFVSELGVDPKMARQRLAQAQVAIFGLEAHGAHLALGLARLGVGSFTLADPFPVGETDGLLMPAAAYRPGVSRQEAVRLAIADLSASSSVNLAGDLSRESVEALAQEATLLVGCFDRGYEAAQHWLNRASVAVNAPAVFAELRTHTAAIGPHVLPGQTACYMCYRMRRVACDDNYDEAMAYERFLNDRKQPALSSRATAPALPAFVASILLNEIVKVVALQLPPTLAGKIIEFDALTLATRSDTILRQPECPVCRSRKKNGRVNPAFTQLIEQAATQPSGDLRAVGDDLVSSRVGIVRRLDAFAKDAVEPAVPYVVRAQLANHRFISQHDHDEDMCSGKGLTLSDARVSALGEAVERYSGASFSADEIQFARRSELRLPSLDPADLVLYDQRQYENLPYARYDDTNMGWVAARSLVDEREVMVPALAVFMNYHARHDGEFLFPITSNGLAAGRTLLEAVWAAAVEVLERDAFMIAWLNRLAAARYAARSHPEPQIAAVAEAYDRRGVEIRLYRLPTEHPVAVFAAAALESRPRGGPAAVFGLGADPDPIAASRKAVLEVCQVRPSLRRRLRHPETQARLAELLADPHRVTTIDDHDLLYASVESLPRLAFWLDSPEEPIDWVADQQQPVSARLHQLVRWLRDNGHDLLYVNLTPPDMAELGLYTARAIVPRFQPIDFGWRERRLGGTRLYSLVYERGLRERPQTWDDLNDDPHPLA